MHIAIASDHAGFILKEAIRVALTSAGHEVSDLGAFSNERSDYPDFGVKVARAVSEARADRGILVCGSGIGMCMVANKLRGVRAVVVRDEEDARLSREHNDANIACLGERVTEPKRAVQLIEIFLSTTFAGGRHAGRVAKIDPR